MQARGWSATLWARGSIRRFRYLVWRPRHSFAAGTLWRGRAASDALSAAVLDRDGRHGLGIAVDYCLFGESRSNLLPLVVDGSRDGAVLCLACATTGTGAAWARRWCWRRSCNGRRLGALALEFCRGRRLGTVRSRGAAADVRRCGAGGAREDLAARRPQSAAGHSCADDERSDGARWWRSAMAPSWRPAGGQSRLRVAGEMRGLVPGDRLRVFAQLGRQPPPLNPGQYDWAAAERREGRLCELFCDDPQCVAVERAGRLGERVASAATRCGRGVRRSWRRAWASAMRRWCWRRCLGDQERLTRRNQGGVPQNRRNSSAGDFRRPRGDAGDCAVGGGLGGWVCRRGSSWPRPSWACWCTRRSWGTNRRDAGDASGRGDARGAGGGAASLSGKPAGRGGAGGRGAQSQRAVPQRHAVQLSGRGGARSERPVARRDRGLSTRSKAYRRDAVRGLCARPAIGRGSLH